MTLLLCVVVMTSFNSAQIVNTGHYFETSYKNKYENQILNCDNDMDCKIICSNSQSCLNSTINCPTNKTKACTVLCQWDDACDYANINWNQGENINNTLTCSGQHCYTNPAGCFDIDSACDKVSYPPPINDNTSYILNCSTKDECEGVIITCPKHAQCNIICSGYTACSDAIINCPLTAECNVECTGYHGCRGTIINWSTDINLASLICPDDAPFAQCNYVSMPIILNAVDDNTTAIFHCDGYNNKNCTSATINCPTDADCIVNCTDNFACIGFTVHCPINGDCDIICDGVSTCRYAILYGPYDNYFQLYCRGTGACVHAIVHAENSAFFNFVVGASKYISDNTGASASFWFPPKNGTVPRAYISGYDNFGFHGVNGYEPQKLYAINGWLDVDIHFDYTIFDTDHVGIMYCNYNYTDSCYFASDGWKCDEEGNTICDNPFNETTDKPTQQPTTVTISPSVSPSDNPTSSPSIQPTITPSDNPSESTTVEGNHVSGRYIGLTLVLIFICVIVV